MNYFLYEGTISEGEGGFRSIVLGDINDMDKPPAAIKVPCKALAAYLEARSWDDAEERYIPQGWLYDSCLFLQAVIIPSSKPGWPAKVIACKDPDHYCGEVVIFGPKELINEPQPAPMDRDAFLAWSDHCCKFYLHPRNLRTEGE